MADYRVQATGSPRSDHIPLTEMFASLQSVSWIVGWAIQLLLSIPPLTSASHGPLAHLRRAR